MLQYLLNTTAIWLISLVMFDVFLRRESYHSYNRFYLLFTFLLGAFLPLLHWQNNNEIYATPIGKPMQQVITFKESLINTAPAPADTSVNWQQWLFIIYLAGVFVVLCLLVIEIIRLSSAYTTKRSYEGSWTVIETGKEHAPFSFLNTLFVCSRVQYNDDEWSMILTHEKRHTSLFHITDLVLMQLARVLFWFHPLVYLYNKRLLLVHEYQADSMSSKKPQTYGKFLIEQALLQSAPALSHSFNRSPIKNRIVMLTHTSSTTAKTKMLVFIPLLLLCVLFFSKNIFSQTSASLKLKKEGNILHYNGYTIEFAPPKPPTTDTITDPETGKKHMQTSNYADPPIALNDKEIYDAYDKEVARPKIKTSDKSLCNYVMRNLEAEFTKLDNGEYFLIVSNVVINAKGKIVYFENDGIYEVGVDIDEKMKWKKEIDNKINDLMTSNTATFKPAMLDGKPVSYLISNTVGYTNGKTSFKVKDHKVNWYHIEEQ